MAATIFDTLTALVNRQFPHTLIQNPNPVFDRYLRHMGWPATPQDIKRFALGVIVGANGLGLVWWLLNRQALVIVLVIAVAVTLLADLYYVVLTVNTLNRQFVSGEWEVLQLTPLPVEDIFAANYAAIQIRAWRMLIIEIACRSVPGVLAVAWAVAEYRRMGNIYMINSYSAMLGYVLPPFALFLVEPLWRMRVITTVSMAIAAQIRNWTFGLLAAFGATLLIHLLPLLVMASPMLVLLLATSDMAVSGFAMLIIASLSISQPVCILAGLGAAYFFYRTLQKRALNRALYFAFRPE